MEVLKESGKPVAATMCIGPEGDKCNLTPGQCAVKLVKAGNLDLECDKQFSCCL